MSFRVIIAGSRDFSDYDLLRDRCDLLLSSVKEKVYIISGKAKGADKLGEKYAEERGIEVLSKPADWDKYGKAAGYIRNEEMAKEADACICFWNKISPGTKNMIELAKKYKLKLRIIYY